MKCDFKTLPLILYQVYNVIVSLSLFVVVYTISQQKTLFVKSNMAKKIAAEKLNLRLSQNVITLMK